MGEIGYCEAGQKLVEAHLEAERERSGFLEKQQMARGKNAELAFLRATGIVPVCWSVTGSEPAVVLVGDLKIKHVRYEGDDWFHLWGDCPKCGGVAWSKACWNAATLGGQLVNFEPDTEHIRSCPAKVKPLPRRERLRLAWRILREGG